MTAATQIKLRLPAYAEELLYPVKYKSLYGGRGSSKTHTMSQLVVARAANLLPAYEPGPVRIACARTVEAAIEESNMQTIRHYIAELGLDDEFHVKKNVIDHANGSHIFFPGITNKVGSFLSMEGIDILWIEQAEQLTDEMTYVEPTIRKDSAELWFSWNPGGRTQWCWKRFCDNPEADDINILVNWRDNPWWPETGLERLRVRSMRDEPELYPWVWEGAPLDTDGTNTVLPFAMLQQCLDAYRKGLAPPPQNVQYAGLDLAEGGVDKCALVIRDGPTIHEVHQWPGVTGDLSVAANKAHELCLPYNVVRIYYDASSPARTDLRKAGFKGVIPVNFGGSVGGPDMLYEPRRTNKDVFAKRNIQMAMALRLRANRTLRLLKGEDIDPATCLFISDKIPRVEEIMAEWSQPTRRYNITKGYWELEKADVGERSPDRFDGLCLSYAVETHDKGLRAR